MDFKYCYYNGTMFKENDVASEIFLAVIITG